MTVGKALVERTGYKLFHNHMSIRLVRHFFDFGTPEFSRLDQDIRFAILREVAAISIIFTVTGGEVLIVELEASLEHRLVRNKGVDRLEEKPSKRDVVHSEAVLLQDERAYRLNSIPGELARWRHLKVNNDALSPEEVARIIDVYFNLNS